VQENTARRADLADLTAFVAVVDNLSFRAAASRLGVTPSALSHTVRHFEERLGFRLLNRTTRSVSLLSPAGRHGKGSRSVPFGRFAVNGRSASPPWPMPLSSCRKLPTPANSAARIGSGCSQNGSGYSRSEDGASLNLPYSRAVRRPAGVDMRRSGALYQVINRKASGRSAGRRQTRSRSRRSVLIILPIRRDFVS
jgi:hypothetical protein